jgi:hypothetical protein
MRLYKRNKYGRRRNNCGNDYDNTYANNVMGSDFHAIDKDFENNYESADKCVNKKIFDCGSDKQVIRHQHIVKHHHDIIHEYDVIHEHNYNYYDVVNERSVCRNNDCRKHEPNYCEETTANNFLKHG